jgi:type IV secretion system protein VirD4
MKRAFNLGSHLLQTLVFGFLFWVTTVVPVFMILTRDQDKVTSTGSFLLLVLFFGGFVLSCYLVWRQVRNHNSVSVLVWFQTWLILAAILGFGIFVIWISRGQIIPWFLVVPFVVGYFVKLVYDNQKRPRNDTAHFATPEELGPMQSQSLVQKKNLWRKEQPSPPPVPDIGTSLLVGIHNDQVLSVRKGHGGRSELGHVLIAAPTRSGKGRHLTANLLNWCESMICLDIKGENYQATAGHRKTLGNVFALNPKGVGHTYDPFAELRHSDEALLTAAKLLVEDKDDHDKAFSERAANGVLAALLAAKLEDKPTLPYLDALLAEGLDGYIQRLANYRNEKINKALTIFLGYRPDRFDLDRAMNDRFLNSAWGVLTTRVAPLLTEGILKMTGGSNFSASHFYERTTSLYLIFPESESEATSKIFRIIMLALMLGMIRAYDEAQFAPNQKILLALDEVGRTPIPKLPDYIATIAGRGMSALLYVQSLSQLNEVYGDKGAETILDNCRTQIYYPTPNVKTQEYVSKLAGMRWYEDVTVSSSTSYHPGEADSLFMGTEIYSEGSSVRWNKTELLETAELRTMYPENTLIFTANYPPIVALRLDPVYVNSANWNQALTLSPPKLFDLEMPRPELPKVETEEPEEEERDDTAKGVLERVVKKAQ